MSLFQLMREDVQTVFHNDPAARSILEVMTCYPGLHAIWWHRVAHGLYRIRCCFLARMLSNISRFFTHIEIHPGASIGRRFFIDHGCGVVIGETTEIADDVLIYQGVVLGGTTLEKGKRHPSIGCHVVIGAGAILLGNINIGSGARIGAGSVVISNVPAEKTVVGVPARIAGQREPEHLDLNHGNLGDPVIENIQFLINEYRQIRRELDEIANSSS
ncbi:serine O-acetyltransferase [bacterium]|nr:serine O-acetyltransferase [bacterium]